MRALIPWLLFAGLQVVPAAATDGAGTKDNHDADTDPQDTDPQDTDEPFRPGTSASDLAGETGGMDCSAGGGSAALLLLLPLAGLGRRRTT